MENKLKASLNPETTPILYTDKINIAGNKNGVVLNVMQRVGRVGQVRIVARIGMSREHAKTFAQKLGELILMTEGRIKNPKSRAN